MSWAEIYIGDGVPHARTATIQALHSVWRFVRAKTPVRGRVCAYDREKRPRTGVVSLSKRGNAQALGYGDLMGNRTRPWLGVSRLEDREKRQCVGVLRLGARKNARMHGFRAPGPEKTPVAGRVVAYDQKKRSLIGA